MVLRLHEVEKLIKGKRWDRSLQVKQIRGLILGIDFVFVSEGEEMKESSQRINYIYN